MLTFDSKNLIENESVVAIGNFDGLHLGHQSVLKRARAKAGSRPLVALSFWPHPRFYFQKETHSFLLSTLEERHALLSQFCTHTLAIPFDGDFVKTTAQRFVNHFLIEDLKAKAVFVGRDFRFGNQRKGSIETLIKMGEGIFETMPVDPIRDSNGEVISSTRIRKNLKEGEIGIANQLLGRPYQLAGKVIHGEGKGTGLGFPTANLSLSPSRLIPGAGIYATYVEVGRNRYKGATYIGTKPTYHTSKEVVVETFLCDFEGDIYGDQMSLAFVKKVREDKKFSSMDSLKVQIGRDVESCRQVLEL